MEGKAANLVAVFFTENKGEGIPLVTIFLQQYCWNQVIASTTHFANRISSKERQLRTRHNKGSIYAPPSAKLHRISTH